MATTINAYSVSLGLNVAGLVEGGKLARSETAAVVRTLKGLQDPAEKIEQQLNLLEKAYQEGAIAAGVYEEATKRLRQQMQAASDAASDHGKKQAAGGNEIKTAIKGMVTAYIGLEGIRAGINALKDASDRIDELDNRSQQLGESVPNLQKFEFALAQMANIDAGTADQMLVRMTRSLGSAKQGSAETADTFRRLGLDINQLSAMSPVEQFNAIAAAIAAIPDPALRAAEATKIFGKEGAALLPVFNQGADAVANMMAEAERLGIVLTADEAAKVAAMNDELDKTAAQFQIVIDRILVAMTPAISAVVSLLQEQDGILAAAPWLIGKMVDGFGFMFAVVSEIYQTVADLGYALYKASQGDFSFFGKVGEFDKVNGFLDRWEAAQRIQAQQPGAGTATDAEALAAAEAHTKEYEKQVATLEDEILAMERGEVVARQIKLAAEGYSDAEIERLETLRQQLDTMKQQEAHTKEYDKQVASLEDQLLILREGEDVARRMKLAAEGYTEAEINKLEGLRSQIELEKKRDEISKIKFENPEARQAGSAAAIDFVNKLGREETDKQLKAMLEQKAIQDQQLAQIRESNRLLNRLNENKPTLAR